MKHILLITIAGLFLGGCAGAPQKSTNTETNKSQNTKTQTKKTSSKTMANSSSSEMTVSCSVQKDQRSIQVNPVNKGCEVLYTKFGETTSVASSAYGLDHCKKIQDRIQGKLEAVGFSCK